MNAFMLQHELAIRLACFFGVFGGMALWEFAAPRRRLTVPKLLRWANNLALIMLNSVLLRALFPAAAVGVAAFAARQGWGLLNYSPCRCGWRYRFRSCCWISSFISST